MSEIEKKFADITEIFASDAYTFLKIRSALAQFDKEAKAGDNDAAQLVDIFNKFHRLCTYLSK